MATENQQVSSQPGDEGDLPTPSFSEAQASPTSYGADEIVNKLYEKLAPAIEQTVEKKLQSTRDKWIDKIQKKVGGRSDLLAELQESGVEIPKDVLTEMRLRELEGRDTQTATQPAPVRDDGSSQQKAAVTEAIAELNKYGLSSNDPGFIELLRGKYANRDAFDKAVMGHIVGKLAPQKPANPADVVQAPATGASAAVSDVGPLIAELNEWQKTPSQYRAQIKQRVAELDKRGWK